jgi:hypothetical protein
VLPDSASDNLLVNAAGDKNENGWITCEVEPLDALGGEHNLNTHFGPLDGRTVKVRGVWVEDLSHSGKTEIHPIASLLSERPKPAPYTKRFDFFVFSDDSGNWLQVWPFPGADAHVPTSGESQHGSFAISYPDPPDDDARPTFRIVDVTDRSKASLIRLVNQGSRHFLEGSVESGTASDDEGFFHADVEMSYAPASYHHFSGVWRAGSGQQELVAPRPWPAFLERYQQLGQDGMRLANVVTFLEEGERLFAGVFREGSGAHSLFRGDRKAFLGKAEALHTQGQRIVDVTTYSEGGTRMFLGAWRAASHGEWLTLGEPWADFVQDHDDRIEKGERLVNMMAYVKNGTRVFGGLYRPGSGASGLFVNTWDTFEPNWEQAVGEAGLRLIDLVIYPDTGRQVFGGVYAPGDDGHYLWVDVDWAALEAKAAELEPDGLRLVSLVATRAENPVCGELAQEIVHLQARHDNLSAQMGKDIGEGKHPGQDPELKKELAQVAGELTKAQRRNVALGCAKALPSITVRPDDTPTPECAKLKAQIAQLEAEIEALSQSHADGHHGSKPKSDPEDAKLRAQKAAELTQLRLKAISLGC